jgi:hypothetical protein
MTNQYELLDNDSDQLNGPNVTGEYLLLNDKSVFYKGLFGMVFCILPGAIIGLVLVKMSLEQSKESLIQYKLNPNFYSQESVNKLKLGRKFAWIGLIMFILEIVLLMVYMSVN